MKFFISSLHVTPGSSSNFGGYVNMVRMSYTRIFWQTYIASSDIHDQIDGREVGEWESVLDKFKQRKSGGPYF